MVYLFEEMREMSESAACVEMVLVVGLKSRTGSMMAASRVLGQAIMYCQVQVMGSKIGWIIGLRVVGRVKDSILRFDARNKDLLILY